MGKPFQPWTRYLAGGRKGKRDGPRPAEVLGDAVPGNGLKKKEHNVENRIGGAKSCKGSSVGKLAGPNCFQRYVEDVRGLRLGLESQSIRIIWG